MSPPARTPTPEIDLIWSPEQTTTRWHALWLAHLQTQVGANPDHPGSGDIDKYHRAAKAYSGSSRSRETYASHVEAAEKHLQHDVAAHLHAFNTAAGAHTAHLGLTSHDIVEAANQTAVRESWAVIYRQTRTVAQALARLSRDHADTVMVGRTHGQPAQPIVWGLRHATILDPLLGWVRRVEDFMDGFSWRPTLGPVGTGDSLSRVVPSHLVIPAHGETDTTRQVYHRVVDLHVAALLAELASLAQTWATDRRLEAMLGLGAETRAQDQIGSSIMAAKTNPVLSERICSLAAVARGWLSTAAELASAEWLEGDVSGSAGRRELLPGVFRTASQILFNWLAVTDRWTPDLDAIAADLQRHMVEMAAVPALLDLQMRGIPRGVAYSVVQQAVTATRQKGSIKDLATQLVLLLDERDMASALHPLFETEAPARWAPRLGLARGQIEKVAARVGQEATWRAVHWW